MYYYKSPIFYMGNKYELLPQLKTIFPNNISTFYDLFGGSGVVSLNINSQKIIYNEINTNIVELFKLFKNYTYKELIGHIKSRIKEFNLTKNDSNNTYYNFRNYYNNSNKDYRDLYLLTYYSFSNLIRFNNNNDFNMPCGNQSFIENKHKILIKETCKIILKLNIDITSENALNILKTTNFKTNDFIYLDPPYLNTTAIYNENRAYGGWNIENDYELFNELDKLSIKGIKWCLSNVKENKGIKNTHLIEWAKNNNYTIIGMNKNYYSLGKGNSNTYEICIINYKYTGEHFKHIQESLF